MEAKLSFAFMMTVALSATASPAINQRPAKLAKEESMRHRGSQGFTLVELAVVLAIAAVLVTVALVGAGRFFVEDNDALRAANTSGLIEARVVERHNFFARLRGCTSDDAVAFTVAGTDAAGSPAEVTVCCGTWFHGCTAR